MIPERAFHQCAVIFMACLAAAGCAKSDAVETEGPTYRNLSAEAQYVGKEACRTCHPDKYETFTEAQMGRSFKPALLTHSAAHWDDVPPVYDDVFDLHYQAFRRGQELFIREYRLADGDTVHNRVEQIDYIVGSGQHTNSHILEVNGYMYQMPMTWYAQDGKWDLPPKFRGGNNYRFDRPITEPCMTCHNAMPDFIEGSENRFEEVPHGIDCERCHGPGSIHIEEKQAGQIVDVSREIDYSIVNPGKLPINLQFDVCQRCHMQGATIYKEGMGPRDFRPGMPLSDVLNVFWPRHSDSTSRFIMASHPDRLKMSECFLGSHGEASGLEPMTCTTCHDPHLPIETLGADHYQAVCSSCHTPETGALCTEDLAVRMEVEDNCVQCHMPVSGSSDIPHVRVTDHFIRVAEKADAAEVDAVLRRVAETGEVAAITEEFVGLASLIDESPTEREMAEGYMTYYEEIQNRPDFVDSAAVHLELARDQASLEELAPSFVRLYHLQRDFDATVGLIREVGRGVEFDGWTYYRIGEAYHSIGDVQNAVHYFEEAVRVSPDHPRFLDKLGSAYTDAGRLDGALEVFDRLLGANPNFAQGFNNRGFARILQRDFAAAEADFLQAIELDPDAEMAMANLASLFLNTNRTAEARPYARRLLDAHPQNPDYKKLWDLVQ